LTLMTSPMKSCQQQPLCTMKVRHTLLAFKSNTWWQVRSNSNMLSNSTCNLVRLDETVENNRKLISKEVLIRKPKTSPFPPGFDTVVERSQGKIVKLPSERALLNRLLVRIHNTDPDVIVGHNFVGFDLDVLLHRMKNTKADHWSRIGRLRRTMYDKI